MRGRQVAFAALKNCERPSLIICLSVKVLCMIAIPPEAEQKTDLVRIGEESINEVNLSSVKFEAYNLWQLLLNDPLGDGHEHERVLRLKKGPVHPRSCHEELPNLLPRAGEGKYLYD